ncbi:hypothetical protein EJB05_00275, partial [Eragrostis curvula]
MWRRKATVKCGDPVKDVYHVAVTCSTARKFWQTLKEMTGKTLLELHPLTWATDLLAGELCPTRDAELFICGAWSLWTGRNRRKHGENRWSPKAAVKHISSMLQELICMEHGSPQSTNKPKARWSRPDEGWIKVNTDGAFDARSGNGGSGVVLRRNDGGVVVVEDKWYASLPDAVTSEALAARDGVLLAVAHGCSKVILESDCSELVNLVLQNQVTNHLSQVYGMKSESLVGFFLVLSVLI